MSTSRLGVGVASLNGSLYAVGGSDGESPLATMEQSVPQSPQYIPCSTHCRYDPAKDEWSEVCPMAVPRKHLGLAVLDGLLYAAGGRNHTTELSSVERCARVVNMIGHMIALIGRYDPDLDQWSSVVAMTCCRSGVGLAVVNGRLYAGHDHSHDCSKKINITVGGFDGSNYLKSVEWLDTKTQQWTLAGCMSYRRLGCGVGVVWTS